MAFAVEIKHKAEKSGHAGESYCQACSTWHDNDRWIFREDQDANLHNTVTERRLAEKGTPDSYVTTVYQADDAREDVYECPVCYFFIKELNDEDDDEEVATHLCGACGDWYSSLEGAQECCEDATEADPDVFLRAMREE